MEIKKSCPQCNSKETAVAVQVMEGQLHQTTSSSSWIGSIENFM
jgi:hypothetical protein